jgi:hypothetical protein
MKSLKLVRIFSKLLSVILALQLLIGCLEKDAEISIGNIKATDQTSPVLSGNLDDGTTAGFCDFAAWKNVGNVTTYQWAFVTLLKAELRQEHRKEFLRVLGVFPQHSDSSGRAVD